MTKLPVVPRPASTLILVRDGTPGMEVFLMQRSLAAKFMAGAFVFPGGAVDPADADPELATHCGGLDDACASRLLNLERGGLAYWTAAIRECFEEAGLLLACEAGGDFIRLQDPDLSGRFAALRGRLAGGELGLAGLCREHGLTLALDRLAYLSHWITPLDLPRRFDTRFFVAVAPAAQIAAPDFGETIDHLWIRPAEALERYQRQEIKLATATIKTLETLAGFAETEALMRHVRALAAIAPIIPRPARGSAGRQVVVPSDHAYAEVGKLDPAGSGNAACEIQPGVVTRLSERVRRIAAPNPSFMTGPGTNSYLVGEGDELALIDPGPALEAHVEALLREAGGRIRWILATHTHLDHSPAAQAIQAATGAQLLGMAAPPTERQDQDFVPDRILLHGERLRIAGCTLRVLHTPGHASNHLCYLLEEEKLLFTGDHIMQGSTVVINPPDGDMGTYLASLRALLEEDLDWLAPGHGFLMDRPRERIERLMAHRMAREEKVLRALRELGIAPLDQLVAAVYDDVPLRRHAMASRSLLAHLLKLGQEGRAIEMEGGWQGWEESA
jgi:glyoxylase-like metal-dependent hydrolase (beta-lactamase superfamily II)/8-oxo-dGTP pyrophosphatase MutT (NUDIX family)